LVRLAALPAAGHIPAAALVLPARLPTTPVILRIRMLAALKQFLNEFTEGEKSPARFDDNDYRLAAAALLVHTAMIDGGMSDAERNRLHGLIMQRFALDAEAADELIREATEVEQEAVDLYGFTSLINRSVDEEGRCRIVEMMWQVVYADGEVSEFEDNLIWRAADLLGVSRRVRIGLRRQVAGEQDGSDSTK
jgi:uncharacterized tellurite resistance protein B-like protein